MPCRCDAAGNQSFGTINCTKPFLLLAGMNHTVNSNSFSNAAFQVKERPGVVERRREGQGTGAGRAGKRGQTAAGGEQVHYSRYDHMDVRTRIHEVTAYLCMYDVLSIWVHRLCTQ